MRSPKPSLDRFLYLEAAKLPLLNLEVPTQTKVTRVNTVELNTRVTRVNTVESTET